jgi:hypothetical protein
MRIVVFSLLGLMLLSVAYSWYHNSAAPGSIVAEPGDVIHPGDDPVKVVAAAREAMLNVRQPYRCKFEWPGLGSRLNNVSTFEAVGREHYRLANEQRAGALVQKEDEMIMAGGEAFRRKADGPWQRLTASELEWWQQDVGPPLPLMSGLGTQFDGDNQNPRFGLQGRQRLGDVEVYEYSAAWAGKTFSSWIGVKDGLPHKTHEISDNKDVGRSEMTTTCTFEPITIQTPLE